ncbi:MAG: xanthine dehydrogenase family protein, partial [Acidimicrobiaceae bacterium]|nr:xanthine dehydrogenase family protein [Acidimicrobiaceae bacterium]
MTTGVRWTGRSLRRFEDPALVRGLGRFVADVADQHRGTLHAAFVRSPVPAGEIRSIEAPPGAPVLTAASFGGIRTMCARLDRPDFVALETPVLASDAVRHPGEPVALVVAGSRAEAEDLAEQVVVDIEATRPVLDAAAATDPAAPTVHAGLDMPMGNNVVLDARFATEGLDAAFEEADEIVALDIRAHRQNALPIEARGAVAAHDPATGRTTLTAANQMPHMLRTALADILDIGEAELRVVTPEVGGAFGQKMCVPREYVALVAAARLLGATIAWIEDRSENLLASWHSRDHSYRLRGAFDRRGMLLGLDADIVCNIGAYSNYPVTFGVEPLMAMAELPGPYRLSQYRVRSRAVTTNMCPIAPYRGVSRPVLTLAMERLMDTAARRLDLDPVEIRRANLVREFPYAMPTGLPVDPGSYVETLDAAVEALDLEGFRRRQQQAAAEGRYVGVGFSVFGERTGYGTPAFAARAMEITPGYETVQLEMNPSGDVTARIGASPHGQGLATALSQLLADELGVEPRHVSVVHGDTDTTPYGWGTFASRSMVIAGGAAKLAAERLAAQLREIAAHQLEASPEDIRLEDGSAVVAGTSVGVTLPEIARIAHHSSHLLPAPMEPGLSVSATYDPGGTFSNACHAAVVEVGPHNGQVHQERFVVIADRGLEVKPKIVEGQI